MKSSALKNILTVTIFCFAAMFVRGQDFKQAILEMRAVMENARQVHIVMDVSVYENATSKTTFYHDKVEVNRDKNNYLYHYSNNDFLLNDRYMIMVDKNQREISIRKRDSKAEKDFGSRMNFNIDSILSLYENPQHVSKEKDVDHFRVVQKGSTITRIDLYVNSTSHLLQKMEYLYSNDQRVVINFDVFDTHPVFTVNAFDDGQFVQEVKGKIYGAGGYKQYRVLDN